MLLGKQVIPRKGSTKVESEHPSVLTMVNTSFGQQGDGQRIGIVGICVKQSVLLADGSVIHSGTIGNGLVGFVEHVVFL